MNTYIVRLNINEAFAWDRVDDLGEYVRNIYLRLPKKAKGEDYLYRFSFLAFTLKAKSRRDVRRMVANAWEEEFPGVPGEYTLFITPDTGDDQAKLMTSIYRAYEGFEPYQEMVTGLRDTINGLRDRGGLAAVRHQNYLVSIDRGCGFTTLIGSLGDYLRRMGVVQDAERPVPRDRNVEYVMGWESDGAHYTVAEAIDDIRDLGEDPNVSLVGIDISRWQGDVDFERVKAAGCEFVYMRIGGLDDGELYTDRYYRYNIEAAKAAGLKIGIYWHAEESTPEEVKASVAYLMDVLDGEEIDYPIAYDWEDFRHFENYGMNFKDLNDHLDIFVEEIGKRGYPACLYNSKYYLETIWTNEANLPIWLANYTSATAYKGDYFMWQHSNTGRIDGIEGDVDLDVMYLEKPGEEEPEEL